MPFSTEALSLHHLCLLEQSAGTQTLGAGWGVNDRRANSTGWGVVWCPGDARAGDGRQLRNPGQPSNSMPPLGEAAGPVHLRKGDARCTWQCCLVEKSSVRGGCRLDLCLGCATYRLGDLGQVLTSLCCRFASEKLG